MAKRKDSGQKYSEQKAQQFIRKHIVATELLEMLQVALNSESIRDTIGNACDLSDEYLLGVLKKIEKFTGKLCSCCGKGTNTVVRCPKGCGAQLCQDCLDNEVHTCEPG